MLIDEGVWSSRLKSEKCEIDPRAATFLRLYGFGGVCEGGVCFDRRVENLKLLVLKSFALVSV